MQEQLRDARTGGDRAYIYDLLAGAIHGFDTAIDLWPENQDARAKARRARESYAMAARDFGDFGFALAQLTHLSDVDIAPLRDDILKRQKEAEKAVRARRRTKRLALSASLMIGGTAFIVAAVFFGAASVGRDVAARAKAHLEREGWEKLTRIVTESAHDIATRRQLVETSLVAFAHMVETSGVPEAPGGNRADWFPEPADIVLLDALVKNGAPLVARLALGLEASSTVFVYPEDASEPDIETRESDWYQNAAGSRGIVHTLPRHDPATGRLMISSAVALRRTDGALMGVARVDSYLTDILHEMVFPRTWGDRVETEVVIMGAKEAPDTIQVLYSLDEAVRTRQLTAAPLAIRLSDPRIVEKIAADRRAGRAGVVEISRWNRPVYAGYAPLTGTETEVMVSVPKNAFTSLADDIESGIMDYTHEQLLMLAKGASLVFLVNLAGILWVVRRLWSAP